MTRHDPNQIVTYAGEKVPWYVAIAQGTGDEMMEGGHPDSYSQGYIDGAHEAARRLRLGQFMADPYAYNWRDWTEQRRASRNGHTCEFHIPLTMGRRGCDCGEVTEVDVPAAHRGRSAAPTDPAA